MTIWPHKTPGIPDNMFERSEGVPITKEEPRAIQLCKARLQEGQTVYDIGCGSGSITVESALQVGPSGKVLAVDRDPEATSLTRQNLERFHIKHATVISGNALDVVPTLPPADTIFIGGTGGDTANITRQCTERLRPAGRIVIGVILIETLYAVLECTKELDDLDVTQITISKSRRTSTGTMMLARNPVTIISASKPHTT